MTELQGEQIIDFKQLDERQQQTNDQNHPQNQQNQQHQHNPSIISHQYFSTPTTQPQKAQLLINLITHNIQSQISNSHIQISQKKQNLSQINLKLNKSKLSSSYQSKSDEKKLAEIIKKRKQLEEQMNRLKYQQEQQKEKIFYNKSPSSLSSLSKQKMRQNNLNNNNDNNNSSSFISQSPIKNYNKTFRSFITPQQQLQISRIKKSSQQFQQKLQQKQKILQQQQQKQRLTKLQQHQQYLQSIKQKKHQQSLKNLQLINKYKLQRQKSLKSQNKQYSVIKSSQPNILHKKVQHFQQNLSKLKQQKQKQLSNQKRKQMLLNIQQIRKHQKKYYQKIKLQKQKLQQKIQENIRKMKQKQQKQIHKPSKFLTTVWRQQQQRLQLQQDKLQKMKQLYHKKNTFQQKLRQQHKVTIKIRENKLQKLQNKQKQQQQQKKMNKKQRAKSLTALDIYRLGNQNMKQIHKTIKPQQIQKSKIQLQQNYHSLKSTTSRDKFIYPDYLKQSKLKRQSFIRSHYSLPNNNNNNTKSSTNNPYQTIYQFSPNPIPTNPQLRQLNSIISSTQKTKTQKLYQAKLITQKIDSKVYKNNNNKITDTKAMINSIAAKIRIIEEFGG